MIVTVLIPLTQSQQPVERIGAAYDAAHHIVHRSPELGVVDRFTLGDLLHHQAQVALELANDSLGNGRFGAQRLGLFVDAGPNLDGARWRSGKLVEIGPFRGQLRLFDRNLLDVLRLVGVRGGRIDSGTRRRIAAPGNIHIDVGAVMLDLLYVLGLADVEPLEREWGFRPRHIQAGDKHPHNQVLRVDLYLLDGHSEIRIQWKPTLTVGENPLPDEHTEMLTRGHGLTPQQE